MNVYDTYVSLHIHSRLHICIKSMQVDENVLHKIYVFMYFEMYFVVLSLFSIFVFYVCILCSKCFIIN